LIQITNVNAFFSTNKCHWQWTECTRSTKRHISNNKKQRQQNQTYKQNIANATAAAYGTTLHQCIQVAGLARMRVFSEKREAARINDRIVAMHSRAVAGIQALINEHKYLIDNTEVGDPNRTQYPPIELKDMNAKLGIAIQNLRLAEHQRIIDDAAAAEDRINRRSC
jgi:hypothetical protein